MEPAFSEHKSWENINKKWNVSMRFYYFLIGSQTENVPR